MENPYAPPNRRKKDEPQSKNHFQRELEEKLRQKGYKESDSEDELGSDDELMHGFNMTSKGKPKWTPPSANKKPLSERNAQKTPSPNRTSPNRTSKAEIIFGKKGVEISDSDESEDEENSPSNGLMKTMKPWQSPSQLARKSKEKDDVDADVSHYSRYDNSRLGGTLKESSSLAKHRPKSPKSNSNLDLDAIKEEREPEPASRPKPQPRATKTDPKLRSKSPAEQKSRGSTPTTDLFGSKSSKRDISPKTPEKKCSANDDDESKRRSSILDMLGASNVSAPKDSKRPSDKTKPSKQGEKKKLLLDEDSDDSIGAEYGRPGPSPYAKHGDRKSPKHPFDDRRSPYDKDRRSPYDKDRRSPYDKDRRSPYDIGPPSTSTMDRARLGHIRGPLDDDYERKGRRKRTDHTGATMNPFKDSIYEESNKKKNPFAKDKDEDRHRDDRRSPYDKDRHRDDRRSPYGKDRHNDDGRSPYDKHHRDDEKTDRKKNPFAKDKDDRKSPYDERYTDDRRSPFEKEHRDDHRSPYDKDRRNPFDKHRSPDRYDQYERTGKDRAMKNTRFEDDEEEWQRHKREQEERSRSKSRRPKEERGEERESSLCRDVDKDPSSMRRAEPDVDSKRKTQTRRSHTTENKILDQVIDAVDKEQSSFKPIDPANKQTDKTDENKQKQRSQSARRPKPRYAKPVVESFPTARPATADFNNTCDIRDLVYREWYEKRTKLANEERQKKLQQEKAEQEKNKKAEEEKKMEAELSYKSWLETKKEKDPEKYKEKKKEIMKEEEKKKEQEDKKAQAAKNYKYWKENKDIKIREEQRKKKEEEEEKKREEERKMREKEKDAESAKREWERQKAIQLDKEARQKRKEEAQKKREEERKQRERDEEARKKYDEWMRKKEMNENKHTKTTKTRHLEEIDNPRPAWSPANRTIPFGR